MRDYGTGTWEGGDEGCDHTNHVDYDKKSDTNRGSIRGGPMGQECTKCGARRIDSQIGLESSPDEWAARLVDVFREVRRVLRDDGTLWVECGDSYASNPGSGQANGNLGGLAGRDSVRYQDRLRAQEEGSTRNTGKRNVGVKPKDLIGQPWLLAFALRADGWFLRSCIIWSKPNAMPESVTDRPTTGHSYVFLFSKKPRYFYDAEALREPAEWARWGDQTVPKHNGTETASGWMQPRSKEELGQRADRKKIEHEHPTMKSMGGRADAPNGKNARTVWQIPTEPNALAICRLCDAYWQGGAPREHCGEPVVQHFAAFPRELVRRMILAGTSERGVCAECGAPWVRETQPDLTGIPTRMSTKRAPVDLPAMAAYLREHREAAGLSRAAVDEALGTKTLYSWFEGRPAGTEAPTPEQWTKLREILDLGDEFDAQIYGTVEVEITDHGGAVEDERVRRYGKAWNGAQQTLGWHPFCECPGAGIATQQGRSAPGDASDSDRVSESPGVRPATVLDPFSGSGTTLLVARSLGRHAVGVELNLDYARMTKARMAQQSLFADVNG